MSSNVQTPLAGPVAEISLIDLAKLLIREYGIHEGWHQVVFKMNLSIGNFSLNADPAYPGVMTHIVGAALAVAPADSPLAVDAALVNPRPKPASRKRVPKKD